MLARLFTIDVRALAALRIGLGAFVLVDLALRVPYVGVYYSDAGIVSRQLVGELFVLPSLYTLHGSTAFAAAMLGLTAVFAGMLLVGFKTRLATVALWILLGSLFNRNPLVTYGADKLIRLLLLWSIFLPLGARWSVDARRGSTTAPSSVHSVPGALLLLQFPALMTLAGLNKTGPMWIDGSAIQHSLSRDAAWRPLGELLLGFPTLTEWMAWLVPPAEIVLPLLLFSPWLTKQLRLGVIASFVFFMTGLGLTLRIVLFPVGVWLALLPFLPADAWDRLSRGRPSPDAGERQPVASTIEPNPATAIALSVAFVLSLAMGLQAHLDRKLLPASIETGCAAAGLYQNWEMYADAGEAYVTLEAVGVRKDRTPVAMTPANRDLPGAHRLAFQLDDRGVNLLSQSLNTPAVQTAYARWLCREFGGPDGVAQVQLIVNTRSFVPGGGLGDPTRRPSARVRCASRRAPPVPP